MYRPRRAFADHSSNGTAAGRATFANPPGRRGQPTSSRRLGSSTSRHTFVWRLVLLPNLCLRLLRRYFASFRYLASSAACLILPEPDISRAANSVNNRCVSSENDGG